MAGGSGDGVFDDHRALELSSAAWDNFRQVGDLNGAANALRSLVSAKCALLDHDVVELARAGVDVCHNSRGRQLGTELAEAKMLLAFAEAACRSEPSSILCSEAIAATEKAHETFLATGDAVHRAESCVWLAKLHVCQCREENSDSEHLRLSKKASALAFQIADLSGDTRGKAKAWLAMAAAAFVEDGEWQPPAEKALEASQDVGDPELEVEARLALASWHLQKGAPASCLEHAQEVLDILQEQGAGSHRQLEATRLACAAHVELENPGHAQRLARELLRSAQVDSTLKVQAYASRLVASVQLAAGDLDSESGAIVAAERAASLSRSCSDLQAEARAVLLVLQAARRKLAKAPLSGQEGAKKTCLLAMQTAFGLADARDGLQLAVELLGSTVETLSLLGKASEALPLATRLQAVCEEDLSLLASILSARGKVMLESRRFGECVSSAQESARLYEESGKQLEAASALSVVAQAQMKQGKLSASRQNARRARRRFGEAGDHEQEIQLRLVVVRACLAKDERGNRQQRDAFREAQEAMKMAAELGKADLMAMTLAAYARACFEMDQHDSCCQTVEELLQMQACRSDCRLSALYYGALASEKLGQYLNAKRYAEQALETEAAVGTGNTLAEQAMCISETEAAEIIGECRVLCDSLQKKLLLTRATAPLLVQEKWQQDENRRAPNSDRGDSTAVDLKCHKCGCRLPWDCNFCPDCGAKQIKQDKQAAARPSARSHGPTEAQHSGRPVKPAVQGGFLNRAMQREEDAPLQRRIQEITGKLLGLDWQSIEGDVPLSDIGLSSGAAVMLRDELQADVRGIKLPATLFFDNPTIREVLTYLNR
ncbi:hypothetical protein AK812_SmicGene36723 [Symbiodinium microadriaticum]|uniref:Uncharacterized protein n=1 Tax=Symbiodinium microadriaticum TaxID=2951 RepID=A0A1Q9CIC7_SYMMI|nr:hypothetical protein AK812_SmicGene36723 [Symbiodinium microadriaticum]CAE7541422.1 unnamed protein product [Symbiodinium microadriaticum]CAE7665760.1 unnamed protein product [Symbiodinium sp. KB8]